jgi:hypothetical protein
MCTLNRLGNGLLNRSILFDVANITMLAFTVFMFLTLVLVKAALSIIVSKPSWSFIGILSINLVNYDNFFMWIFYHKSCIPALVVQAPSVKYTMVPRNFSISNINNDFAQAGWPVSNVCALSWDSNARNTSLLHHPDLQSLRKPWAFVLLRSEARGFHAVFSFLIKSNMTHHLLLRFR